MPYSHSTKHGIFILILLFCLVTSLAVPANETNKSELNSLTFGVLPMLSTHRLIKRFSPLAEYLSDQLGMKVILETAPDFRIFMQRTNQEKRYDILFTAPHFYYLAENKAGYKVIAQIAAPEMVTIIAVPTASPIQTVSDLRNKTLSTTDPLSLSTILLRQYLLESGLSPDKDVTLVATPTHSASLISAYKHITDAASLMMPPFKRADKNVQNGMRIIASTKGVPHMPFSVAPWIKKTDVDNIQNALLNIESSFSGKKALDGMQWPGIKKATSDDYKNLGWVMKHLEIN